MRDLVQAFAGIMESVDRNHADGGSRTYDISWVRGYGNILDPHAEGQGIRTDCGAQLARRTEEAASRFFC